MKKIIFTTLLLASMAAGAKNDDAFNYRIEGEGHVASTTFKTWNMDDPKSPKFFWVTTVSAQAYNVQTGINKPVKASGTHKACWNNSLFTSLTASYVFTLTANGKVTRIINRFSLPGRTIKCITQNTYLITSFPIAGNFQYTANSHAETILTTPHDAQGNAFIMVR